MSDKVKALKKLSKNFLFDANGKKCMSLEQVHRWVSKFNNGQTGLYDKRRPGESCTALTDTIRAKITDITTNDGRLTIKQ